MAEHASGGSKVCTVILNAGDGDRVARLHRSAQILEMDYEGETLRVVAVLSPILQREYRDFLDAESGGEQAFGTLRGEAVRETGRENCGQEVFLKQN